MAGMINSRAKSATVALPLLELDASCTITGASITGSASDPAVAVVVKATNAASVRKSFHNGTQVCVCGDCVTLNLV
jgi:hypothetical protein